MKLLPKYYQIIIFLFLHCFAIVFCEANSTAILGANIQSDTGKAFARNRIIGRGINFGNALEAPNEGDWGLTIKESYIQAVSEAGFNSVRLPICWSAHTSYNYPYIIVPAFLKRVDEVTGWCLKRKLAVVITIHHFDDLYNNPDDTVYRNMVFSIWKQLSTHYAFISRDSLFFEIMNEPEVNLTSDKWNIFLPQIIDTIRKIDSDRTLIVDGPDYAYHGSLGKLIIPESEQNVIVSTRYYLPMNFAQQGAWWMPNMNQYLGTTWSAKSSETSLVLSDMSLIQNWAKSHKRPITIGEYGSIMYADNQSRLCWTNYVRTEFEKNGFSWSYFDFGVVFKAYSTAENKWLPGFVEALTGNARFVWDGRCVDSLRVEPVIPTEADTIRILSYIKIPNNCSSCDSLRKSVTGTTIRIFSYHTEHLPPAQDFYICADSIELGRLSPGNYTVIFNSDYIDPVNTIHYSILDTALLTIGKFSFDMKHNTKNIIVYPVPASRYLIIENLKDSDLFKLYSMSGQLSYSGKLRNGRINISGLKPGQYLLTVTERGKQILKRKIIIAGN